MVTNLQAELVPLSLGAGSGLVHRGFQDSREGPKCCQEVVGAYNVAAGGLSLPPTAAASQVPRLRPRHGDAEVGCRVVGALPVAFRSLAAGNGA